jgi:hypothetical protein
MPPGWVAPGAVPVRPDRWDLTTDPATYRIAGGDTLVGLAATYLRAGERWKELWNMQDQAYRWSHSPDKLAIGEVWPMPEEAVENLKAYLKGKPVPGGKTVGPGQPKGGGDSTIWWCVGGGIAAAAAAAGLAYYATR